MSLTIYIPTRGRIGLNRQVTLREFLANSSHKPVIICPPDEVARHKAYYPRVTGCPAEGIGPTRQWILEHGTADVVVMADDDMRFSYRPVPNVAKLERCTKLDPLMALIEYYVTTCGFVHGGVGARQGNNRKDGHSPRNGELADGHFVVDCERVNNMHFVDRKRVLELGVRFDALPVMEDFHFTLSLITQGYPNRVIHDYVWNQEGSGADGGCSIYRSPQVQAAGAEGLAAAFPAFVRVVTKVSKDTSPAWKQFKERKDVVVSWLKAWESSQ
jgi:hypothetical protein